MTSTLPTTFRMIDGSNRASVLVRRQDEATNPHETRRGGADKSQREKERRRDAGRERESERETVTSLLERVALFRAPSF